MSQRSGSVAATPPRRTCSVHRCPPQYRSSYRPAGLACHPVGTAGEVCLACHVPGDWPTSAHSTSVATWSGSGDNPWPDARYTTVADNACRSCHRPHAAGAPQRLLNFAAEEDNCLRCHSGSVAARNIRMDLGKPSAHSPFTYQGSQDPAENPRTIGRHG